LFKFQLNQGAWCSYFINETKNTIYVFYCQCPQTLFKPREKYMRYFLF